MLNLEKIPSRYQKCLINEKSKLLIDMDAFNRVFLKRFHKAGNEGFRAIVYNDFSSDYISWWLKHNLRMKNYKVL